MSKDSRDFNTEDFFNDLYDMLGSFGGVDFREYRGADYGLDDDDGYREWSETIEKQNQEFQDWESMQFVHLVMDKDEVMSLYDQYATGH